jgi:hypothetical protein
LQSQGVGGASVKCADQNCFVVAERRRDALFSCSPSNRLAQNLVILSNTKTVYVEPQMQTRRDIGNLVTLVGMIARSERQLAELGR